MSDPNISSLVPLAEFTRAPLGRATSSGHAVFWLPRPDLRLVSLWGKPDEDDVTFLLAAMETEIGDGAPRHASYVDLRDFVDVDAEVFQRFLGFMGQHRARFASTVLKSAVVTSARMSSAAAAGYTRLLGDPFPSRVFESAEEALEWLGEGAEGPALLAELARLVAHVRDAAVVARLHDLWHRDLQRTRVTDVARELGVSARLLQRQLTEAGTTFRDELRRARVARAKVLLRDSDAKLYGVATEVGFEKAASLIDAFKRETGMTPERWRREAQVAK